MQNVLETFSWATTMWQQVYVWKCDSCDMVALSKHPYLCCTFTRTFLRTFFFVVPLFLRTFFFILENILLVIGFSFSSFETHVSLAFCYWLFLLLLRFPMTLRFASLLVTFFKGIFLSFFGETKGAICSCFQWCKCCSIKCMSVFLLFCFYEIIMQA